jgi:hypothetical protein
MEVVHILTNGFGKLIVKNVRDIVEEGGCIGKRNNGKLYMYGACKRRKRRGEKGICFSIFSLLCTLLGN